MHDLNGRETPESHFFSEAGRWSGAQTDDQSRSFHRAAQQTIRILRWNAKDPFHPVLLTLECADTAIPAAMPEPGSTAADRQRVPAAGFPVLFFRQFVKICFTNRSARDSRAQVHLADSLASLILELDNWAIHLGLTLGTHSQRWMRR